MEHFHLLDGDTEEMSVRSRIVFTPTAGAKGTPTYQLEVPIAFDRVLL